MSIKKRAFAVVLSAIMLLSVAGIGTASAITKSIGGGTLVYYCGQSKSGVTTVSSKYYHKDKKHGTSVKVGGNGKIVRKCAAAKKWTAPATKKGYGKGYVYYHTVCYH